MGNKNAKKDQKKNKSYKKRFDAIMARKGMSLVLILAVMILVVSIVSLSFSWFRPGERTGIGVGYNAEIALRSENCAITTYYSNSIGAASDGKIIYYDEYPYPDSNDPEASSTVTVPAGERVYFKTVIENLDVNGTNVSLYISQIPESAPGGTIGLGVATPSNTYHTYSAQQTDVYIIRNAFVHGYVADAEEDYFTVVEWFVRNNTASDITVDLSKLYLMYN